MRGRLKVGTRVQLWPYDTHYKYAVVVAVNRYSVTFEITEVHPGEKYYRPGDRVEVPWSRVHVYVPE